MEFPDKPYVSLEDPAVREQISFDSKGFLEGYPDGVILDEFQNVPEIASYLQQIVDEDPRPGLFVLTGSHSLEVMEKVSQSLAGRTAVAELLPFSFAEIHSSDKTKGINDIIPKGFYPPVFHRRLTPSIWYSNYIRDYLERDVRRLINVKDLNTFQRFIALCAGRVGQLINFSNISSELGVSHNTIKAWLSILEASYIIYFLYPYHGNFGKRVVKTPKLYFYDTGLVSWLLSIKSSSHFDLHPLKGAIFECFCVTELIKQQFNRGERSNLYFWRDKSGHEIDVILEDGLQISGVEIKSSKTFTKSFGKNLRYWEEHNGKLKKKVIIMGTDETHNLSDYTLLSWRELKSLQ